MCGFFCNFTKNKLSLESRLGISNLLKQRGPDYLGYINHKNFELLHARLSIIDLNANSNQPMYSDCKNYIIVFNGEIYNYEEIRNELINCNLKFKTNSDTEVILQGYIKYKEKILHKLRGMFSFVIYDIQSDVVFAARDPYGIKPLYYSITQNGLIIGSQIRYFKKCNLVNMELSPEGVFGFYYLGSVAEPFTWYKNILAVEPGTYMTYSYNVLKKYKWHYLEDNWIDSHSASAKFCNSAESTLSLLESVKAHTTSDVPISIFLSSGVDSIALGSMIRESGYTNNVYAITITNTEYPNQIADETSLANKLAKELSFKHIVHNVTKNDFISYKYQFLSDMDQPSMDGLNNWIASKVARENNIKVALSGVGGDELFSGYDTFSRVPRAVKILKNLNKVPVCKRILENLTFTIAKKLNNKRINDFNIYGISNYEVYLIRRSITSIASAISLADKIVDMNNFSIDQYINEIIGTYQYDSSVGLLESYMYMKNQLLKDADWASSAHGVEIRTPYIDSFLFNDIKKYISRSKDKSHLINCVHKKIRTDLIKRKKTGFDLPIKQWLDQENKKTSWQKWIDEVSANYV